MPETHSFGEHVPLIAVLPFALLLAAIAILPLAAAHFWESNRNKGLVTALVSAPIAIYLGLAHPSGLAHSALEQAGRSVAQMAAIKTHNPFALNDIVFARATGCKLETMNNFGCSLVWGHPQAPMGTRAIIELIEELALRGGGFGLFTGCAAGDTAMSVVIEVGDA